MNFFVLLQKCYRIRENALWRAFSFIFTEFHPLLGFAESNSGMKRYRDTVHYINPVIYTV